MRKVTKQGKNFFPTTLGERIMYIRTQNNVSQLDLAEKVGISRNFLSMIENGERVPNVDTVHAIADSFQTTCDYLIRGNESENVDIHRRTGLSDKAIKILGSHSKLSQAIINMFIESPQHEKLIQALTKLTTHLMDFSTYEGRAHSQEAWDDETDRKVDFHIIQRYL
jgi:transcriptional regulator with XRE-family HTH domain